jgi:tetratricopeptide (TPR) repeat protein
MSIEALKEKARRHEQKEEWQKALDLYREALEIHDEDEPPDVALLNRIGDIQTRLGQNEGAVRAYQQAIDLYVESELPNNAIAVCKKVLRNLPDRDVFFLRMGQIRGDQGFLTDARQNFMTYAERRTEAGDVDAAMDALVELVDLVPEDVELRMALASQLEGHEREEEAVEQYGEAYRRLALQNRDDEAEDVATKVTELDPDADLPDPESVRAGAAVHAEEEQPFLPTSLAGMELGAAEEEDDPEEKVGARFGEVDLPGGEGEEEESEEEAAESLEEAVEEGTAFGIGGEEEEEEEEEEMAEPIPSFGLEEDEVDEDEVDEDEVDEDEEEAEPLPTFSYEEPGEVEAPEDEEEEAAAAEPLPTFSYEEPGEVEAPEDEEEEAAAAEPLPTFDYADPEEVEAPEDEEAEPLPTFGFDEAEEESVSAEEAREEAFEETAAERVVDEETAVEEPPALGEPTAADDEMARAEEEIPAPDRAPSEEIPDAGARVEDVREMVAEEPGEGTDLTAAEEVALEEEEVPSGVEEVPTDAEEIPDILDEAPPVEAPPPPEGEAVGEEPRSHEEAAEQGNLDLAMQMVREQIEAEPDQVEHYQRLVEYAFRTSDQALLIRAYMQLAGVLVRTGATAKAKAVYQQVLSLSPGHEEAKAGLAELEGAPAGTTPTEVASSEEYVDLGSMILGEDQEKTTRWKVAADTPSGDEDADFAKMLSQFKQKVSENVDAGDVAAHHDLGTAYMEMGLLDEAISEFQMALRAKPDHLPTYEVMGRCWVEMGKPDMAVRSLERALTVDFEIEDELIGIYYLMGRAKEELGHEDEAAEFYEKVFSLDINFEDVTERLRTLR